jgi:DNA-binding MarR family transcriptional regulator
LTSATSCSIQEIGNALNFTKSGATRIIDRLENKGYVIREQSLIDSRVCCVTITPKGKETTNQILEKYTFYLEDALKDLQANTIDQIKNALDVLVKTVQEKEMP